MLQITDEARTTLKNALDGAAQEGHVFKLDRDGEDLAVSIGEAEASDEVFELNGEPVLAVSAELCEELDATIDVEHTTEGTRLVLV